MNPSTYPINHHPAERAGSIEPPRGSTETYQLISKKEVASLLAISQRTVDRLVSAGDIPRPLKVGGCTRFRRIEILNFIHSATTTGR